MWLPSLAPPPLQVGAGGGGSTKKPGVWGRRWGSDSPRRTSLCLGDRSGVFRRGARSLASGGEYVRLRSTKRERWQPGVVALCVGRRWRPRSAKFSLVVGLSGLGRALRAKKVWTCWFFPSQVVSFLAF